MRYLKTTDIQQRYNCSAATARSYMRRMEHTENPLRVSEAAADAWDLSRTVTPGDRKHTRTQPRKTNDYRVPRIRPA